MGEQKQFRSEEARKNYEKQEKLRARAAQRKALTAKKNELIAKAKSWLAGNKKLATTIAVAAAVVIVLVWLLCKWFVGPGGSIPNFFGHLVGVQDNWLIIDTADKNADPRYHHLADFDIPEGYKKDNFTVFTDGIQQDFYCTPVEKGGLICDFYISAPKNTTGKAYLDLLLSYQTHKTASEPKTAVIAGKNVDYVYMNFDESDTDGEGMGFSCLCIYMDTKQGSCVSAMINSYTVPEAEMPGEAELLAEAEYILAGLTLVK